MEERAEAEERAKREERTKTEEWVKREERAEMEERVKREEWTEMEKRVKVEKRGEMEKPMEQGMDTKERILLTALELFAREGYEAVSVSSIAGALGLTKGALYKHYRSKRDIFDHIVERMVEIDAQRSRQYQVPEVPYEADAAAYGDVAWESVRAFTAAQLTFWTEDGFARSFRRMLVLEQYRSGEMAELYHSCLVEGPAAYMAHIFSEMMDRGLLRWADPQQLAMEYYAPLFFLMACSDRDGAQGQALLAQHMERFFQHNRA